MAQKGKGLTGALSKMPREKAKERLSPGVYRGESGGLVGKGGRNLRQPEMAPPEQYNRLPGRGMEASQIAQNIVRRRQPGETSNLPGLATAVGPDANKGPMQTNMNPGQTSNLIATGTMPEGFQSPQGIASLIARNGANPGQMQPGNYMVPSFNEMYQPSANNNGQYRLSPGVYGTREQAMNQYNESLPQFLPNGSMPEGVPGRPYRPIAGLQNGLGQQGNMPLIDWSQAVPYGQRKS